MSYKKFPLCASSLATGLGMLALTLLFGLQPASGEEASADPSSPPMAMDHSGHASAGHENHQMGDAQTPMTGESETHAADHSTHQGANAHHHHHPVPAVTKRSLASYSLPDVTMVDQNGKRISLREILSPDEPVMLNFIFTTCTTICPVMTATFAQVQKGLGSDAQRIRMVSISIDPEQDTPRPSPPTPSDSPPARSGSS